MVNAFTSAKTLAGTTSSGFGTSAETKLAATQAEFSSRFVEIKGQVMALVTPSITPNAGSLPSWDLGDIKGVHVVTGFLGGQTGLAYVANGLILVCLLDALRILLNKSK
jgi:hypothetical protein